MYSEIKYDGERVQVHKQGKTFKYYSRSLKPVMAHKVGLICEVFNFLFLNFTISEKKIAIIFSVMSIEVQKSGFSENGEQNIPNK